MKNKNIPCENEGNLTKMDLLGSVFSLVEAAHEQDTNKAKAGLERCVDNEADCAGCPYEDVEACHGKLMEDALKLITALEELYMMQTETIVALFKEPQKEASDSENA